MAVQALAQLGVKYMFGVVGIPVTPLASSAQVRQGFVLKVWGTTYHAPWPHWLN